MNATHKLSQSHAKGLFPDFICVTPTSIYEMMQNGSWVKNNNFAHWMDYYSRVEGVDSDCEDACFNAIQMRNTCNELSARP